MFYLWTYKALATTQLRILTRNIIVNNFVSYLSKISSLQQTFSSANTSTLMIQSLSSIKLTTSNCLSLSLAMFVFITLLKTRVDPVASQGWLLVSLRSSGSPRWRHRRPIGLDLQRMRATPAAAAPLLISNTTPSLVLLATIYTAALLVHTNEALAYFAIDVQIFMYINACICVVKLALRVTAPRAPSQGIFKGPARHHSFCNCLWHIPRVSNNWDARCMI